MEFISIVILAVLVNNVVLVQLLGINPYSGVFQKTSALLRTGGIMIVIMSLANLFTYLIHHFILVPAGIPFLQTILFILVIALLVWLIEVVIKKARPSLIPEQGIYRLVLMTNCVVLGIAILAVQNNYGPIESMVYAASSGAGFTLVLVLMSGLQDQTELNDVPEGMRGIPIFLITAGLLSLAFMGFTGMVR